MKRLMLLAMSLLLATQVFAASYNWPQWRGPNGDGTSTETGWNPLALNGGVKVLWNVNVGGGYSSVAIQDSRLYTMGLASGVVTLSCLDATTGELIWQCPIKEKSSAYFPQSTPTINGDRVYGLSANGTLFCVQAADGKIVWQKDLQSDFHALRPLYCWSTSPIIDGDLLLVNANSRALALEKSNGSLSWAIDDAREKSSDPDKEALASVVVTDLGGTRCALFAMPTMLRAVDVNTGKVLWSFTHEGVGELRDLVVSGGRVFDAEWSFLLEPAGSQPKVLWTSNTYFGHYSSTLLWSGYLYGTQWPDAFHSTTWGSFQVRSFPYVCMDWNTGQVVWRKDLPWLSATAADGKIIALELNGTLHIAKVTPSGYQELSSADVLVGAKKSRTFATPPVLCNGMIYCRNLAGDLVCIDVSK